MKYNLYTIRFIHLKCTIQWSIVKFTGPISEHEKSVFCTYIHFCDNIQKLYVSLFLTLNLNLNNNVFLDNCVEITCHFNTC